MKSNFSHSYFADNVNVFIRINQNTKDLNSPEYELMVAPTKGHVCSPISKNELKNLAHFINNFLENINDSSRPS